jgi:hypothetical protein
MVPPAANFSPFARLQFFGQVDIDGPQAELTVTLKDISGASVFTPEDAASWMLAPKASEPDRSRLEFELEHVICLVLGFVPVSILFTGFDEYLVEQFVRRPAVGKSRVVAFKVVRALDAAVFRRHILLRNIDPERVRAVALLKLDLAFPGEEPVHEQLGGIGMRRFIDETDGAAA